MNAQCRFVSVVDVHHYQPSKRTLRNIQKSKRENVEVSLTNDLDRILALEAQTTNRQGFTSFDKTAYHHLKTSYGSRLLWAIATKGQQDCACGSFIAYGKELVYLAGGSSYAFRQYRAPFALHDRMIQYAKEQGFERYNFYGISGYFEPGQEGYGVFDFKRGFGANIEEYVGELDLVCQKNVYRLFR